MNPIAVLIGLSALICTACATQPEAEFDPDRFGYSIPISDFDGYDPYPPNASGAINAYVNFAKDGLLRVSLGCLQVGAPYGFSEDERLIILSEGGLSEPDYSNTDCSDELIAKEKALSVFIESQPKVSPWTVDGVYLRTARKTLLLQSVAHVLDIDTTMKVND